ncbi:MAG: carboxymuconolactone decarboxylase family protein [Chloroflexi bacterium]|nr:carboxymuconolactone decarboxylase family protein [Chloroflexota bacterium]
MTTGDLDLQAIVEEHRKARGDTYWETERLFHMIPEVLMLAAEATGYVHRYEGKEDSRQELSLQMRELIAVVLLTSKGEERFAANHVRRLYRMGVTDALIIEAFLAAVPVLSFAVMLHAVRVMQAAKDPSNREGALPPGGEPKVLVDFPELHLGDDRPGVPEAETGLGAKPEWQYIAQIDPGLAERVIRLCNMIDAEGGVQRRGDHFPPAARELIAIPALCARGFIDAAGQHMRRAVGYGLSARQILEAISSVLPYYGLMTVEIGAQAMIKAGIAPAPDFQA